MGQTSSSEAVGAKMLGLGEGGAYACVAEAVLRFDLSGGFLVEAETGEIEDFLQSRCPRLDSVQRRRVLFELDCMKRREMPSTTWISSDDEDDEDDDDDKTQTEKTQTEKNEKTGSSSSTTSASCTSLRKQRAASRKPKAAVVTPTGESRGEKWRRKGSKYVGLKVERSIWDDEGKHRAARRGVVVAWCSARDSNFVRDGRTRALWRVSFEGVRECVELEEDEVEAAVRRYERAIVKEARRYNSDRFKTSRQRISSDDAFVVSDTSDSDDVKTKPVPDKTSDALKVRQFALLTHGDSSVRRQGFSVGTSSASSRSACSKKKGPFSRLPPLFKKFPLPSVVTRRSSVASLVSLESESSSPVGQVSGTLCSRENDCSRADDKRRALPLVGDLSSSMTTINTTTKDNLVHQKVVDGAAKKKRGRPRKSSSEPLVYLADAPLVDELRRSDASRRPASSGRSEATVPAKKRKAAEAPASVFVEDAARLVSSSTIDLMPDPCRFLPGPGVTSALADAVLMPAIDEMIVWRPDLETRLFPEDKIKKPPASSAAASAAAASAAASAASAASAAAASPKKKPASPKASPPATQSKKRPPVAGTASPPSEETTSAAPEPKRCKRTASRKPSPTQPQAASALTDKTNNRPKRELAGKRNCEGCRQRPCARSHCGCFRGVEAANGKYIASGDTLNRFDSPVDAARRFDMLLSLQSDGHPPNFDDGRAQSRWEKAFRARLDLEDRPSSRDIKPGSGGRKTKDELSSNVVDDEDVFDDEDQFLEAASVSSSSSSAVEAPGGDVDLGAVLVDGNGRKWYVCHDEETLADLCKRRRLDPVAALAANAKCAHFLVGPKLTLKAKLKHHTRVLLSF